ncbi:fumarylacetoacetate hydrolase family protein [Streptomyces odontomachi]|uniref:fumarylacetoacetate hydrolase family protein n=1 Tax=Streptomyces odontomachi TaxID=2944940 RepID=UPI00210B2DAC|nr:fumarylacetoacetate hydrolase family protein [Streptomyces sp. ODS25]
MKLATIRTSAGTRAVRVEDDHAVDLGLPDLGALLAQPDWRSRAAADGARLPDPGRDVAPVVPRPEKIVCVGINYRAHIAEMGREVPEFPTLFAKFPPALVGAYDDIVLPAESEAMDWEAELAIVVGSPVHRADLDTAARAIAGYTVLNDVTARDWQYRTLQWLQGKTFATTTPVGPHLVVSDAQDAAAAALDARMTCHVDGAEMQSASTADLVFGPAELVGYLSRIMPLSPGDLIATGTPGGVGHARTPKRYLTDGSVVTTRIEGIGECRNTCRAEK